ncbi:ATPase PAAT isoform X2 [Festucalex cinctus]
MAATPGANVEVTMGATWRCRSEGLGLADILLAVDVTAPDGGVGEEEDKLRQRLGGEGVLLERVDADGDEPCVLTLSCVPAGIHAAAIGRLTLVSEARIMEVYLPTGEYCATVRGRHQEHIRHGDRGPLYRKQLSLDDALSSCDVKLLSLAGRSSVLLCGLAVALRPLPPGPAQDGGGAIDLHQVQSLVDEMGGGLSPGAQNLMDMLRFQQKNQSSFLSLLMGRGLLSASPAGVGNATATAAAIVQPPADSVGPAPRMEPPNGPAPDGRLAELMRRFLSSGCDADVLRDELTRLQLDHNNAR